MALALANLDSQIAALELQLNALHLAKDAIITATSTRPAVVRAVASYRATQAQDLRASIGEFLKAPPEKVGA